MRHMSIRAILAAVALACMVSGPARAQPPRSGLDGAHHLARSTGPDALPVPGARLRPGACQGGAPAIPAAVMRAHWFLPLYALALAGLLVALARRRRRLARRRAARAERERIALALHDSLLQNVQGLVLRLHAALRTLPRDGAARAGIETVLDQADAMMQEARDALQKLRTGSTGVEQELGRALANFGHALQQQFGPRFSIAVSGAPRTLDAGAWHALYLIGREAVFNAYQHAGPRHVDVELVYGDACFTLLVRDDGSGMAGDAAPAGHRGLAGMRERARELDGSLALWSRLQAGTELLLRAPARMVYPAAPRPGPCLRVLAILARTSC